MATLLSGNLLTLTQQSLEGALTWSNSTNGTVAIVTTYAFDDTHSLQLTAGTATGAQFTTGTGANAIASGVVPGATYTASARVRSSNARNIRMIANYYNGASFISQTNNIIGVSTVGSFGLVSNSTYVVPAGANKIEVLFVAAGNNAGEVHHFDQLYFGKTNIAPVANAGADQTVSAGASVSLSGTASDPDGNTPLTYAWVVDAVYTGPAIAINNPTTLTPDFTAPSSIDGETIPVNFTATDSLGASTTDQVVVTVLPTTNGLLRGNLLTVAQQSLEGSLKWSDSTNGTASISTTHAYDGTYSLRIAAISSGSAQVTTGNATNAITKGLVPGRTYTGAVRVRSNTARTIRLIANYYGSSGYISQTSVALGTSSTTDFAYLTSSSYVLPAGATKVEVILLAGGNNASETHWFDEIYFGYENQAPVVNAGVDQMASPGTTVVLTGSASDVENDTPLAYQWAVDAAYDGPALALTTPTTVTTSFTAPASVDGYEIPVNFTATDSEGNSTTDQVNVTVYPGPWIYVRESGAWVRRKLYRRESGSWIWP